MRLDKFLSHTGFGSRKDVKQLLKQKSVHVNDALIKDGKVGIDAYNDVVTVNGHMVVYQKYVYYVLNKPKGVISATEDKRHRTVLDLIKPEDKLKDIFPVGRLDKDTTGLLLLTNDGDLAHQLLSPKKKVSKVYRAHVSGIMTEEDVESFKTGIEFKTGEKCLPAKLTILASDFDAVMTHIELEIMEGKFHQVKRMVEAVGKKVVELERIKMGSLALDSNLSRGTYRELTEQELSLLQK